MAREFRSGAPAVTAFADPVLDQPRTYVVMGVPRGGTSMVAGLVRLCGVPLGDDIPNNHEDPAFNLDLYRRNGENAVAGMRAAVEQRDAAHQVWGWKYPRAVEYLDDLHEHLRNPHLVVVLRDPVATAGRHLTRPEHDPLSSVIARHEMTSKNLDLAQRWQVPTMLVSYERGTMRPFKLAHLLAEFLGTPAPTDRAKVRQFVQPGSYQDLPD